MKRFFLTISMVLAVYVASAQFVVGGALSLSTTGGNDNYYSQFENNVFEYNVPADAQSALLIAPKFGYQMNEKMQLGVSLGFNYLSEKEYSAFSDVYPHVADFDGFYQTKTTALVIAPYLRYNLFSFNKFTAFVEAQVSFGFAFKPTVSIYTNGLGQDEFAMLEDIDTTFKVDARGTDFALTVVPGLNYKFNDRCSMDLYIDLASLGFVSSSITVRDDGVGPLVVPAAKDNYSEHSQTVSGFYFGANMNAQTLDEHLGLIRLGFNIHF